MENPLTESRTDGLRRLKESNTPTFAEARREHQSLVFAYVSRRIKPAEEAEDVTAEVFLDAYRHWHRCKGPARLWLLGIARRKVADAYRRRKPVHGLREGEGPTSDSLHEFVSGFESRQALNILLSLPPDERDALSLQILEEMPIEEIAVVIGRSPAATNSLLQRARARVRKAVDAQEETHV